MIALENVTSNTGAKGVIGGQYYDLYPPSNNEEEILNILIRKTVTLFEVAFVLGWLFSGGSSRKKNNRVYRKNFR